MTAVARQMRLVLETGELDAAVEFYRDALGLEQLESYDGPDGARVVILAVPSATLELANPAQVRFIDEVEVGRPTSRRYELTVRVAFEVDDAAVATDSLTAAGATLVAPPIETPWRSLNSRLEAPGGMQITAFEELD